MKWEEAQIFNEAIAFAVFLDSCTRQGSPLSELHKRFHTIWLRRLEEHAPLTAPSLTAYTPITDRALLLSAAAR